MNKIKHHYVWRKYLRAWSDNEQINTYLKRSGKLEKSNLMNVAQQRYFYKVEYLDDQERKFVEGFISDSSSIEVQAFNREFLLAYTLIEDLKRDLAQVSDSIEQKQLILSQLETHGINLIEDIHCKIEDDGNKLLSCSSIEDLRALDNGEDIYTTLLYLCFQYFRTKNMRDAVISSSKGKVIGKNFDKCWKPISFILAVNVAEVLAIKRDTKFILLENRTLKPFITGDQPIFNLLKDELDEKGNVINLELYYAISPSIALHIHFDKNQREKYIDKNVTDIEIDFYNSKIFENSDFFVFANSKEQLEKISSKHMNSVRISPHMGKE